MRCSLSTAGGPSVTSTHTRPGTHTFFCRDSTRCLPTADKAVFMVLGLPRIGDGAHDLTTFQHQMEMCSCDKTHTHTTVAINDKAFGIKASHHWAASCKMPQDWSYVKSFALMQNKTTTTHTHTQKKYLKKRKQQSIQHLINTAGIPIKGIDICIMPNIAL